MHTAPGVTEAMSMMYILAADQSRIMQDQMTGPAMGMPPDPSKAFKVYIFF